MLAVPGGSLWTVISGSMSVCCCGSWEILAVGCAQERPPALVEKESLRGGSFVSLEVSTVVTIQPV